MGRPVNKKYFGQGAGNQIKVKAKVGTAKVGDGFIVKQRGTRKFVVNVGGKVGVCKLVDKPVNSLGENEMVITVLTDANTLSHVTKMYNRLAIVNGQKVKWNFSPSQVDGADQLTDVEAADNIPAPAVLAITAQPVDMTCQDDIASGVFSVSVSSTPEVLVNYQWQWNPTPLAPVWEDITAAGFPEITGFDTNTITIEPAADYDGEQFRVVVSTPSASNGPLTSDAATLTVVI